MKRAAKKEAVVLQPKSYQKYDLIRYFTLMRDTYSVDDAKAWCELYCKRNNVVLFDGVRDITGVSIFMYLLNNGVQLPDNVKKIVDNAVTTERKQTKPRDTKPQAKAAIHPILDDAQYCVEQRLDGLTVPLTITATHAASLIAYANAHKRQIKEDYANGAQTKSGMLRLNKILDNVITECEVKRKPVVKKATTVKTKASQARNVKFTNERLNGSSSLTPDSVIGKKSLWVYDMSKNLLINYISTTGFTFSGTTLKDYVGVPTVYSVTDSTKLSIRVAELSEHVKTLKTRKLTISGRFTDNYFILTHTQ